MIQHSRRHEINVRPAVGSSLCELDRGEFVKLLGALNLPPVVQEHKYTETQEFILQYAEKIQEKSMATVIEDSVMETSGKRDVTVSGDGAWLTREFFSLHSIVTLCSKTEHPKVIDTS